MKKISLLLSALVMLSCANEKKQIETLKTDAFVPISETDYENAIIYEANIRQYSPEGTFEAFTKDIPQLKDLGVKIIWLMPIHPISLTNRKAKGNLNVEDIENEQEREKYLGSPYSISDYTAVNPDFGTKDDLDKLIKTAHDNGMYVILDWVANHTGWDHKWIQTNSDFYYKNDKGEVVDPINYATGESWGWTDVAHLNYENKELWEAMKNDMLYWVKEHNLDGFRCDVAGEIPTPFWEFVVPKLKEIKPIFMLAESEKKDLFFHAFDMGYNWEGHHIKNEIAAQKQTVAQWDAYMQKIDTTFQADDILMNFITNHDENSWNGTVQERMGDAGEAMLALIYTLPGMPLIYSGQEYDLNHRLKFFEKDEIPKTKSKNWPILEKLGKLKSNNIALHGGKNAADYTRITTTSDENVLAFKREKGDNTIIYIANMSSKETSFTINQEGIFKNYMHDESRTLDKKTTYSFAPWEYVILVK
ncbi:MAG: alpha-amlyase [Flavobacteriaceae bacterium CG_4_8_14_3_um_filter_34_10]|nr:alpha-amylase [Flavobacteriia bacterium]PIQ17471.1 MAG: alpha-amlyase [Flavobacteriaceae bacterium CG18_big_fil_WC_8_21_14_2_50_34_36]PIX09807.1 MAG: alpha-amlyase [Flavobacteriaceae bacterium CG_4_8_14_3_um_filter_34_10]PIZ07173.1 MAG: alpha-amlyase [Flavobacteriaceae bacterium CG_4_10_14_0_8_um_filter_34_31]PJC06814.1 MAG: alpha-amlyase [Flavobacteriaceae bacterium CG_4_9_14_0_8_um_filter_34_30]